MDVQLQEPFEEAGSRRSDFEWERARPWIYYHYIVKKRKLTDLMVIMKHQGFVATSKMYIYRLKKWDYHRNVNRSQAVQTLRRDDRVSLQPAGDRLIIGNQNVPLLAMNAYIHRNKLATSSLNKSNMQNAPASSMMENNILLSELDASNVQKRLLKLLDCYIRRSFAEDTWRFFEIDRLIESSDQQSAVKTSIHCFVSELGEGCRKGLMGDYETAGSHWRHAFEQIDSFIHDTYHGVFPNVVQMVCDLKASGFSDLAAMLLKYIACKAKISEPEDSLRRDILTTLEHLPLDQMPDFEERMLEIFLDNFEWHLGSVCYNSFVMVTDHASRRLIRNEQLSVEDSLPEMSLLDHRFGVSDRRPMDVLRVCAELSLARQQYETAVQLSQELISRAILCHDDLWLRLYFLLHGYYLKGFAEELQGRSTEAKESWKAFRTLENNFVKLQPGYLFEVKRVHVEERLDRLAVTD